MKKQPKEPIRIRQKALKNGNTSLYLDIYRNGNRQYEFLKLYLIPEKSKADKEANKQTMQLANSIKAQRMVQLQNGEFGFVGHRQSKVNFWDFFQQLAESKNGGKYSGNKVVWLFALKHLRRYDQRTVIYISDITQRWVQGFQEFLNLQPLAQNSQRIIITKLKAALNDAVRKRLLTVSPAANVVPIPKADSTRTYLTIEELQKLFATPIKQTEIKRAFLFSCLTGLRKSDIEKLVWSEIETYDGMTRITFFQKKTGGLEYLDISAQAADLLGNRGMDLERVFKFSTSTRYINIVLQKWADKAGVRKHISFHVGRHTFATLMLTLNTDLYTVSKLLGHRDIKTTQIYAKIIDKKKRDAVNRIPNLMDDSLTKD